jgi:6-phosphogluconolactonase
MQPVSDTVGSKDKLWPLKAVLEGPHEPEQLPVQLIQPSRGRLLWRIDRPAVRLLQS